jgi:hypothetical protein
MPSSLYSSRIYFAFGNKICLEMKAPLSITFFVYSHSWFADVTCHVVRFREVVRGSEPFVRKVGEIQ